MVGKRAAEAFEVLGVLSLVDDHAIDGAVDYAGESVEGRKHPLVGLGRRLDLDGERSVAGLDDEVHL